MNTTTLQMLSFYAAVTCTFGSAFLAVVYLYRPERFPSRYANVAAVGAFLLLSTFFLMRGVAIGFLPVSNLFESLTFFIWAVMFVYLIVEYIFKLPSLSTFLLPFISLFAVAAAFVARGPGMMDPKLESGWFYLHVTFAFVGYATFAVAFATAVMYLLQRRQLKLKKSFSSLFSRLPSLEILDELNLKLINMGFPLFTFSILTGIVWSHRSKLLGADWPSDPKIIFTGITWLLYAALFHIRLLSVARGKRVAQLTIVAFVFVVITFLGTQYLSSGPHGFLK
jgi:cytochrome c-type biogenesis protein CcsB